MSQQIHTVHLIARLTRHRELSSDTLVPTRRCHHILIKRWHILHRHVGRITRHREEVAGKLLVDVSIYPTLTQIEVQVGKGDGGRNGGLQCRQRVAQLLAEQRVFIVEIGSLFQLLLIRFNLLDFLDDITAHELRLNLIVIADGIVEHLALQLVQQLALLPACQVAHIAQLHATVLVQTCR